VRLLANWAAPTAHASVLGGLWRWEERTLDSGRYHGYNDVVTTTMERVRRDQERRDAVQIIDTDLMVEGQAEDLWRVWTDVDRWAEWDPHEEEARLIDAFTVGGKGYAKPAGAPGGAFSLLEVARPYRWVSAAPLPGGGALIMQHTIEPVDSTRCRVRLRCTARGAMGLVVQLGWGTRMRADALKTLTALGVRAAAPLQR